MRRGTAIGPRAGRRARLPRALLVGVANGVHVSLERMCHVARVTVLVGSVLVLGAGTARAADIALTCPGFALDLSTGTPAGDCLIEAGVRALCADPDSNSVSARCDAGCVGTNGSGSCTLEGEEAVAGSLALVCPEGPRYLLRTRTGKATCKGTAGSGARSALCFDTIHHRVEADCVKGCLKTRGRAICAKYKIGPGQPPPANRPPQ